MFRFVAPCNSLLRHSAAPATALCLVLACSGDTEPSATIAGDVPAASELGEDDAQPSSPAPLGLATSDETPCSSAAASPTAQPLIHQPSTDSGGSCESLPGSTFQHALCACEDVRVAGALLTRSFRSPNLLRDIVGSTANVGANGALSVGGLASVGGDLSTSAERGNVLGGGLRVGNDLKVAGNATAGALVRIEGDAWLGSDLLAVGVVGIGGDLHRPPDANSFGLTLASVGGSRTVHDFDLPEPCDCSPGRFVDITAAVDAASQSNDNAGIGLSAEPFVVQLGLGTALTLPAGDFYLRGMAAAGALRMNVTGKTRLFVDGDFLVGGLFRLAIDPGAELDLFVRDDFIAAGGALFGDPTRPSAARFYVGGDGDIALAGINVFAGNLYAPEANVLVGAIGQVRGSLFAKNVIAAGALEVGYDERVRDSDRCSPEDEPPQATPPTSTPPAEEPSDPPGSTPPTDTPSSDDPSPGDTPDDDTPSDAPSPEDTPDDDTPADDPSPGDTPDDEDAPPLGDEPPVAAPEPDLSPCPAPVLR